MDILKKERSLSPFRQLIVHISEVGKHSDTDMRKRNFGKLENKG